MDRFCRGCGNKLDGGEKFCKVCGTSNSDSTMMQGQNIPVQSTKTNTQAIAALIFSLAGLLIFAIPFGLLSISLGATALNHIKVTPGEKGKGLAIAGIVVGAFDVVAVVLSLILGA